MSKRNKHLGFTIENDLHYKLHYVASYEGRSGSGQIIYVLNQYIKNFEQEHGEIKVPEVEEKK